MSVRPTSYRKDRANRSGLTSMELAIRERRNREAFLAACERETAADLEAAKGPKGIILKRPAYNEDESPMDYDRAVRNWEKRVYRLKEAAKSSGQRFSWTPNWKEIGVFMMTLASNRKAA